MGKRQKISCKCLKLHCVPFIKKKKTIILLKMLQENLYHKKDTFYPDHFKNL